MADLNTVELFKYARLYLGSNNWEEIRKTSKKELKLFQDTNISLDSSYFVCGNTSLLRKFKAFYLTRCLKKRPLYTECSLYEYAEGFSSIDKDEFGLNVSKDLLFLYMHEHIFTLGNSRTWLTETVINKIADRNRVGLITIILSELDMPEFENCGEMRVIKLGASISQATVQEALNDVKNNEPNNNDIYK